jgi:hypothetical protein
MLAGCARQYTPVTPKAVEALEARADIEHVLTTTAGGGTTPPPVDGSVQLWGTYSVRDGAELAFPRLAPASSTPCSGGVRAIASSFGDETMVPPAAGRFALTFRRLEVDGGAPLWSQPTALDFSVVHADGKPPSCLRVPVVEQADTAEWEQVPRFSFGYGWRNAINTRRIYGGVYGSLFVVRFGPWIGPVRLRAELAVGGTIADASNANLLSYAYGGGLLADYLLFSTGQFGLGVAAGYDVTGYSFSANVDALSHDGAGYQGLTHGPRGGLLFELLPPPAPGTAFRARPDATSGSLEVFGGALASSDYKALTPAVWVLLGVDAGL